MDGKKVIEMQNTFGRFMQSFNLNRLDAALSLFAKEARLWMPDYGIDAKGEDQVRMALDTIQKRREREGIFRNQHIPHTGAYQIPAEGKAQGTWLLFSFVFSETKEGWNELVNARVDADFVWEDGQMKISELDWWEVASFEPMEYSEKEKKMLKEELAGLTDLPAPPSCIGNTTASDFYAIQNVYTRFVHNNRKHAMEETFSSKEDISMVLQPLMEKPAVGRRAVIDALKKLQETEKENKGKYLSLSLTGAPVIEVSKDGKEAKAQWMAYLMGIKGEAFGFTQSPYPVRRQIGLVTADYVKENDKWKIHDLAVNVVMTLPKMEAAIPESEEKMNGYCRIGLDENQWRPAWLKLSGDFPDDMPEAESQIAYWLSAYRCGTSEEYVNKYMANEEEEPYFRPRTLSRSTPMTIGVKALLERFTMNYSQYHHQQVPTHSLLAPDVEISEDGRYATLSGYDVGAVPYMPARQSSDKLTLDIPDEWDADHSPITRIPCLCGLARYDLRMVKVDGVWKHYCTEFESLCPFNEMFLAGKNSRGWTGAVTDFKYPALWEKYQYTEERKNGKTVDYNSRPI